jgi:DNA-binding PadR family transcriptional regulator
MGKGQYPGEFELVVMSAIVRLGQEAYGMRIRLEIEEATGRDVSIGAVYATLNRLEQKGMVASEQGEPSRERGGRAKRYFALEPAGIEALDEARRMFARLWADLPESLG